MTLFDYAVLIIVGISVLLSVLRGFVREVLALTGWVAAFAAAAAFSGTVAMWLLGGIENPSLRTLTAFLIVFFLTLIAAASLAMAVSALIRNAGFRAEDRVLGACFGLARGLLIVMVLVLLGGLTSLPAEPVWNNAMLSAPLEALAMAVKPWLPRDFSNYISY